MRLTKLTLKDTGPFKHAEFDFPEGSDDSKADAYVFVGPNGAGKTTALLALAQFFTQHPTGIGARLRRDSEVTLRSEHDWAAFHQGNQPARQDVWANIGDVVLFGNYNADFTAQLRRNFEPYHRNATPVSWGAYGASGQRTVSNFTLSAIQEVPDGDFTSLRFVNDSALFVQWAANTFAKIAFAEQRGDKQLAETRREAIGRLSRVVREVTGYDFELVLHDEPLALRCKINGIETPIDVLSDGVKSVLGVVGEILMRIDRTEWPKDGIAPLDRTHIILLDEVEVHLHPKWQRKVLPAIQTLFPHAQLFVTTHSPFVVASASDAFIYKLENGTVSKPIPASDGQSVLTILRDVLGVTEEFSDSVEADLSKFEAECDAALKGSTESRTKATELAKELSAKGPELAAIVTRQLKLLDRQLKHA